MNKRMFKVYTLWELTIPIEVLKSIEIVEKNLHVSWDGTIIPRRREVKMANSLEEADNLRKKLIPTEEKIFHFQRIIQSINKNNFDHECFVMLSIHYLIGIISNENVLIIRTRQHPSIYKNETRCLYKEFRTITTPNSNLKWDYESQLIRKNSSLYQVYCPLCNDWFGGSHYLSTVFEDERSLWLANMVTHYRHSHLKSWDKMWGRYGGYYQQAAHYRDEDYEDRKSEINERAKRQIARKALNFLIDNMIEIDVFKSLQGTTEITIKTVSELLEKTCDK